MVIIGMLFYIFRKWRWVQVGILALFSLITFLMNNTEHGYHIQRMMIFAAIPMMLYNGKKGKGRKWLFYVFYPAHIFLLYIIAYFWSS